jgi:hypothetical protein
LLDPFWDVDKLGNSSRTSSALFKILNEMDTPCLLTLCADNILVLNTVVKELSASEISNVFGRLLGI